jgi:uncharacterized protein YdaU (DUF1376 family)
MEHYIYRTLIDWYYLDEKQIPKETQSVMRRLGLGLDGLPLLQNVLSDFFIETENGYKHERIHQEIEHYQERANIARVNGTKGGRPKGSSKKPRKTQSVNFANPEKPSQKLTNNHKPITNNINKPESVSEDVWNDFLNHRKTRKSAVTERVINSITKEAKKAGWTLDDTLTEIVTRGWNSFKAEWVVKQQQPQMDWE